MTISYTPTSEVQSAHHIPHLSSSLNFVDPEFDVTKPSYLTSLIPFPLICFLLGLLCIIIYSIVFVCRFCCRCWRCIPEKPKDGDENHMLLWKASIEKKREILLYFFGAFLFCCLLGTNFLLWGNSDMNKGVHRGKSAFNSLSAIFQSISDDCGSISDSANNLYDSIQAATCVPIPNMDEISSTVASIASSTDSISDYIGLIPDILNKVKDEMVYYGEQQKNVLIFLMYFILMALYVALAITIYLHSRFLAAVNTAAMYFVVVVLFVICPLTMVPVMLLGDFCMQPANSLVNSVDSESVKNFLLYYTSCTGANPIGDFVNSTIYYNTQLSNELYDLVIPVSSACTGDLLVQTAYSAALNMTEVVNSLVEVTECEPFSNFWNLAFNQAICQYMFSGFYILWSSLYAVAISMFFMLCVLTNLKDYFGHKWNVGTHSKQPNSDHELHNVVEEASGEQVNQHSNEHDNDDNKLVTSQPIVEMKEVKVEIIDSESSNPMNASTNNNPFA